ncbi:hypothetical protein PSI22_14615, partial [Xenorhabdus sp. XENO-7]
FLLSEVKHLNSIDHSEAKTLEDNMVKIKKIIFLYILIFSSFSFFQGSDYSVYIIDTSRYLIPYILLFNRSALKGFAVINSCALS